METAMHKRINPTNERVLRVLKYKVVHLVSGTCRTNVYTMHSGKFYVYIDKKPTEVMPKNNRYDKTVYVDRQFFDRVKTGDLRLF